MRPVKTRVTIAVTMLVILLVALTTTAVLGYFVYERTLSGLLNSRFEFIGKELKSKVEAAIDLGLPLGHLENVDELLRQEMTKDNSLVAISIVNTNGRILFDTLADRIGGSAPPSWLQTLSRAGSAPDQVYFGESAIGLPLFTSFGKMVGMLLVSYSGTFYDDKRLSVARQLFEVVSAVLLAAGVIGIVGVLVISRPLTMAVARLDAGLDAFRHQVGLASPNDPPPPANPRHDTEIERDLLQAINSLEAAEKMASGKQIDRSPADVRS